MDLILYTRMHREIYREKEEVIELFTLGILKKSYSQIIRICTFESLYLTL